LGNGVVVHIPTVFEELAQLDRDNVNYDGRLLISDRAHLVTSYQLEQDSKNEGDSKKQKIGTTKRGIGPTYAA
jgi:adenylosuccinate synthase